jgi:spermidine synthase
MKSSARVPFAVVAACFFISGVAGLIYQVVWSRYLALFLGHTSYAVVAVLVAFMGGLALGNALSGSWADRAAKPLALYAWLEFGIGIYALAFPRYYLFCHDSFISAARHLHPGSTGLLSLKFGFSLLAVLLPTVLMGATFPVLARFVTRSLSELRERVAALYAINSAGAVLGCMLADFWLIPGNGLEVTVFSGAALNLLAGLVAMILSLRIETEAGRVVPPATGPVEVSDEKYTAGELRLVLVAIGLSGFAAMLYEVAWTRLLALALGSSTHAFSLMLVTFITGIAVGAWLVFARHWRQSTWTLFGWAEAALALTLFASLFYDQYLSFWFVKIAAVLARRPAAYPIYEGAQALICFAAMLIPTICLGMTLPLVSRIATAKLSRTGRSVGKVFAINTLGTVLGTVATGLWLMPSLGLARTFAIGVALNAMIGVAVLTWRPLAGRMKSLIAPVMVGVAIVWLAGAKLEPVWERALSLGLWRAPTPPRNLAEFGQTVADIPLKFHRDGAGSTVDVYSWLDGTNQHLTLKINGKADAGNQSDMVTQLLLGHLPLLLRPQSSQVLVIGLGSGITCGAVAQHSSVQRIDAVEISPEVVEAARLFANYNAHVLDSPKFHLTVEDAKSYLQTTDQRYDLIVSEPSNPWMAGVAAVFSREYYESCAARLKPGGRLTQWMHFYETSDEMVNMVLRTFLSVFPYMSVWQSAIGDMILVGGREPLSVDLEATSRRFAEPSVRADLARVGLQTLPALLASEIVPQQNGFFIVPADGPIHSDFLPQLEYVAHEGFFLNQLAEHWRAYREDFSPRAATLLGEYLRQHPLGLDDFKGFARDYEQRHMPEPPLFRSLLLRWQDESSEPRFPIKLWSQASERTPAAELRALRLAPLREALIQEAQTNAEPLRLYAADLMESYRAKRSIFYLPPTTNLEAILQRLLKVDPSHDRIYRLNLAEIAWDHGDDARCLELGQSALEPNPQSQERISFATDPIAPSAVLYRMIESLSRSGQWKEAWSICQKAKAAGYLDRAIVSFPLLDAAYRKVELSVAQTPSLSQ